MDWLFADAKGKNKTLAAAIAQDFNILSMGEKKTQCHGRIRIRFVK